MATPVKLMAYDYTNKEYKDVALDPDSHALLLKDVSEGITDHGDLVGLADDDHAQYYNAARHTVAVHNALSIDHGGLGGLADDDHNQYYNAARHTVGIHNALALDHGNLSGKADDDHSQYLNTARHDVTTRHPVANLRKTTGSWSGSTDTDVAMGSYAFQPGMGVSGGSSGTMKLADYASATPTYGTIRLMSSAWLGRMAYLRWQRLY